MCTNESVDGGSAGDVFNSLCRQMIYNNFFLINTNKNKIMTLN